MGFDTEKDELFQDAGSNENGELFSEDAPEPAAEEPAAEEPAPVAEEPAPAPEAEAPAPAAEEAETVVGDVDDDEQRDDSWAEGIETMPSVVSKGDIINGLVVTIDAGGVIVNVGAKSEGVIPRAEFPSDTDMPAVDERVDVAVVRVDEENDVIILSKRRADYERCWNELEEKAQRGDVVEAMVTERVKGGLRVDVGVPGFVPASHVATRNLRNLDSFVGRSLRLKVLEADRRQKKVILTHRQLVEEERAERRAETLQRLHEGALCEGKVRNITNYGAFVDLGGIDGLLHISEISWTRIGHPSEVLSVGQKVRVVVLEIADDGNRISLGMRQILPDPWKEAAAALRPGSVVKSKITRVVRTGAFAQLLEAGIEGFLPIREMSEKRIGDPSEVVENGQEVDLKILEIQVQARRMTLSMVAAEQEKERAEYRKFMASQETAKTTLGDQFGDVLANIQTAEDAASNAGEDADNAGEDAASDAGEDAASDAGEDAGDAGEDAASNEEPAGDTGE